MNQEVATQNMNNFCDKVPLNVLSSIQPHGYLMVINAQDLSIIQVSENISNLLPLTADKYIGKNIATFLDNDQFHLFKNSLQQANTSISPIKLIFNFSEVHIECWVRIYHNQTLYLVEIEPTESAISFCSIAPAIENCLQQIRYTTEAEEVFQVAAKVIKNMTGYDKIMIYQFDHEWNGLVVAEEFEGDMDSYLGLKFPASDIPKQVRDYYQTSRFRYIPTIDYTAVPLTPEFNPLTSKPTDITHCSLRTVAPVHLEYLNNMHVQSSTSFALIKDKQLWGLITCHHRTAKYLPPEMRIMLVVLAEIIAMQIYLVQDKKNHAQESRVFSIQAELSENLVKAESTSDEIIAVDLFNEKAKLLDMVAATGVLIYMNGKSMVAGKVPATAQTELLLSWLHEQNNEVVYVTDSLPKFFTESKTYEDIACGLIALTISKERKDYILFFRPAMAYTVKWAGNPKETIQFKNGSSRYHPRHSFKIWEETVTGRAWPWQTYEIEAATRLRNSVVSKVLQIVLHNQAATLQQKVAERTKELQRSNEELAQFAYISSHQLKEPLRMISNFTQLLARRYHDKFDDEGKEFMHFVIDGASRMQQLIDDVLIYSQIDKKQNAIKAINCEDALKVALSNLKLSIEENAALITYDELPIVKADYQQIIQLFQNLINNAVKFKQAQQAPRIHIQVKQQGTMWEFAVKDNGIGIDEQYFDRIFKLFHRLHNKTEYPGTGIGLALCKKIVEQYQGEIWVKSKQNQGTTFYFTLPTYN